MPYRRILVGATLLIPTALLSASCATPTGCIQGTIYAEGGLRPINGSDSLAPLKGSTVHITQAGNVVTTLVTDASGIFRGPVAPGTYTVVTECGRDTLTVAPNVVASTSIVCFRP